MTSSITNPERGGQTLGAGKIATGDHVDGARASESRPGNCESTKKDNCEPIASDESPGIQKPGEGLTETRITACKGPRHPASKQFAPTKAPRRVCKKRRFQPYPQRRARRGVARQLGLKMTHGLSDTGTVVNSTSSNACGGSRPAPEGDGGEEKEKPEV